METSTPTAGDEPTDGVPDAEPHPPFLRVVDGDATPEEVAALVAVLASLQGDAPAPKRPAPSWAAPHRGVRRTLPHGAGGWRSSALPR
ncbi:MAG: acyl-CoA carboxylase subunit epsilon [Nocardioides sp.]